jgi:hypothetical protein
VRAVGTAIAAAAELRSCQPLAGVAGIERVEVALNARREPGARRRRRRDRRGRAAWPRGCQPLARRGGALGADLVLAVGGAAIAAAELPAAELPAAGLASLASSGSRSRSTLGADLVRHLDRRGVGRAPRPLDLWLDRLRLDNLASGIGTSRVHLPCVGVASRNADEVHFSENLKGLATDRELER